MMFFSALTAVLEMFFSALTAATSIFLSALRASTAIFFLALTFLLETFATKTFSINIAANTPGHWAALCHILGLAKLIDDPRFKNIEVRIKHRQELVPLLEQALQSKPGEEWIALLKEKGIPCGPINDVSMVVKEPQVLHRDMIIEVENQKIGRVKIPGMPLRVGGMTGRDPVTPPPSLGEHNEEILCGRLGYSEEELKIFKENGII